MMMSMVAKSCSLRLNSQKAPEFVGITGRLCTGVAKSTVANGFVVVDPIHNAAAININ